MARKRQRAHRGSELWALEEEEEEEEDHLLHMVPSLMTERQQMAFLLRTTAHEELEVLDSSDKRSKDEAVTSPRHAKKPKWMHQRQQEATATLIHRGRGHSLKNKHKKRRDAVDTKLRVTAPKKNKAREEKEVEMKPSPSGSDDVSRLDAAQSFGHRAPQCALCCDYDTAHEASFADVLFLCPACDRKYPTQQALGRRTCMI